MTGRLLAGPLLSLFVTGSLFAQDPKLPDVMTFDKLVVDSLRDVHNRGADLYNTAKAFEPAFRMYQGGLLAVRPLLGHRPAAQKMIDEGLAAAEKEPDTAQKAFKLHETIEAVRKYLKEAAAEPAKKTEEPKKTDDTATKPEAKKTEEPKKTETAPMPKLKNKDSEPKKSDDPPTKAAENGVSGKVTVQGKPLAAGEITLVSLDQAKPRVFTATVGADGSYAFKDAVPPGKYAVIIAGKGVPEKYTTTTTSALTFEVKAGANTQDVELK